MSNNSRKGKPIVRRRTAIRASAEPRRLTYAEACDYVYELKKAEGLRGKTLEGYVTHPKYFRDWLDSSTHVVEYISDVTAVMVREYINYLLYEHVNQHTKSVGLSPVTINVRLRNMSAMFNALFSEGLIDINPMASIKQLRSDSDSFVPLSEDEISRLLSAPDLGEYAQFRDYVSLNLILDTGVRCSEMLDIKVDYIDFGTRSIHLPGEVTKNRKPRILPLSRKVSGLLMELIEEVWHNWDTDYVFVSNFGEKYLPSSFTRRTHKYKRLAGLEKSVTPHDLRHQFCRDYIINGGDVFSLQRIAGHSDISTTRKYIQFTDDDVRRSHEQFSPMAVRKRRRK